MGWEKNKTKNCCVLVCNICVLMNELYALHVPYVCTAYTSHALYVSLCCIRYTSLCMYCMFCMRYMRCSCCMHCIYCVRYIRCTLVVSCRTESHRARPPATAASLLPVGLVNYEVTPGDVLKRPLLEVGHLVRRDKLAAQEAERAGAGGKKNAKRRHDENIQQTKNEPRRSDAARNLESDRAGNGI